MYVIRRIDQGGGFVAPARSEHSYVKRTDDARHFKTKTEAERNACENEIVTTCPHCAGDVPR